MFSFLKRIRRPKADAEDDKMPNSIVLLLRESRFFKEEEIAAAGKRAWGERFTSDEDNMYGVVQDGAVTLVKAGNAAMNLLYASRPYFGTTPEDAARTARKLPLKEQQTAWALHRAWMSLDDLISFGKQSAGAKAESYSALARLTLQLADENCCGVYLPKEQIFLPNDGTAEQGLREMERGKFFH